MSSALVERPLVVSPSLAATIGLEAALLYQLLAEWQHLHGGQEADGQCWHLIDRERLQALLPFWDMPTIERVLRQLQDQGLIIIGAALMSNARNIRFALPAADRGRAPPGTATASTGTGTGNVVSASFAADAGSSVIRGNWRPDTETLAYLQRFQGVSADFVEAAVPEFIAHWRETGEARASWNSTFIQHVVRRWKKTHYEQAELANTIAMNASWEPSVDAVEILERSGIDRGFIWDSVPEFVLQWRERGTVDNKWNSRFIDHVRRQWAYYRNKLSADTEPTRIPAGWQPDPAVYDILRMASIDAAFADEQLPEFVLYWRDSKQLQRSWNSKFLQHIKFRWAQRHHLETQHERQQKTGEPGRQDARGFIEKHTDRSWADGI